MTDSPKKEIAQMSFEEAMKELELLVEKLEKGEGSLEDSIASYERGMALSARCTQCLENAKMRVQKILKDNQTQGLNILNEDNDDSQ